MITKQNNVWERRTVHALFEETALKYPDKPYIFAEGRCYTYKEALHEVNKAAKGLMALGVLIIMLFVVLFPII